MCLGGASAPLSPSLLAQASAHGQSADGRSAVDAEPGGPAVASFLFLVEWPQSRGVAIAAPATDRPTDRQPHETGPYRCVLTETDQS